MVLVFLRFLRNPGAFIRNRVIARGLVGGQRRWLVIGVSLWVATRVRRLFGAPSPIPVFTQELDPNERFVTLHYSRPLSRRAQRRLETG